MVGKKKNLKEKIFNKREAQAKVQKSVSQPKVVVVGIGGGGGSIVGEIAKSISKKNAPYMGKIKFVIANVDQQAIKAAPRQVETFYFGEKITYGLGCGMNLSLGEESALQSKIGIEKLLRKYDFCIFITSLGGGTGSGAGPIFAEISKNLGLLTLGICTLPFSFEGKERGRIAQISLEKFKANLNSFIIIPNQRIFRIIDKKTSLQKSLSSMNNILVKSVEGIIETLYFHGLINLDFSDFRATLSQEGALTYLNCQEFSGQDRAEKAVEAVLKNPLISYNITGVKNMLFNIAGDKEMRMSEVEHISKMISDFNPQAKIIFGVSQDSYYKDKIKITLLAVGCEARKPKRKIKVKLDGKRKMEKEKIESSEKQEQEEIILNKRDLNEKSKKIEGKIKKEKKKKINIKKKRLAKKIKIAKNTTVRRDALDLHKQTQENEKKILEEESKWDVPAFLRKESNS